MDRSLGTVFGVSQAIARRRSGAARRQGQASATRFVDWQAARSGLRPGSAAAAGKCLAGAARLLPPSRDARVRRHRGDRRTHAQRRRSFLLLDLHARASAEPCRSLRHDGSANRAHRSLAWPLGPKGISVCATARVRRTGHRHRSRCFRGREAFPHVARKTHRVDALRLSCQARDQCTRPPQAPLNRGQSRGAATRS